MAIGSTSAGTHAAGPMCSTSRSTISITRGDVEQLVRRFYRQVAMDDVLGPVFAAARVDWSAHIPKLADF